MTADVMKLTNSEGYLTTEEKRIIEQDESAPYITAVRVVKHLKVLSPKHRRQVVDAILGDIGKDSFIVSLSDYIDAKPANGGKP